LNLVSRRKKKGYDNNIPGAGAGAPRAAVDVVIPLVVAVAVGPAAFLGGGTTLTVDDGIDDVDDDVVGRAVTVDEEVRVDGLVAAAVDDADVVVIGVVEVGVVVVTARGVGVADVVGVVTPAVVVADGDKSAALAAIREAVASDEGGDGNVVTTGIPAMGTGV
jgi:hypothetical protein